MDAQTLYIILLVLCATVVAALGLFIYLVRKVNAMCDAVDFLLRKSDYMEGEIAGLIVQLPGGSGRGCESGNGYTGEGAESAGPDVCEDDGK